ncbi:MAG: hypothetical protein CMA68_04165 [Euryarchaeota archaeon]|nr:hypothetical protein [Euryarchaeota archaeon]
MPDSFLQFVLRDTEWDPFRKIREHIIGMIPEPVRKIVGWILLIFGAVVLLRVYPGSLFFELADQMFMITFFVGMFSFAYGIILLRHKG